MIIFDIRYKIQKASTSMPAFFYKVYEYQVRNTLYLIHCTIIHISSQDNWQRHQQ